VEQKIADHLAQALDHVARILVAPMNAERVEGKTWVATRHLMSAIRAMGMTPELPFEHGGVEWDIQRVWREVAARNPRGSALDQIWTALQYENPHYVADNPFPWASGKN
jgi:hypothetical protein